MTFDDLKDLKQGAVLISKAGYEFVFLCTYKDSEVVLNSVDFGLEIVDADVLKDWTIKKDPKLYWRWLVKSSEGHYFVTEFYIDENSMDHSGDCHDYIMGNLIRKIGSPIDQDGN
tara:strand:+ start:162 stop:506 length:345 start_codon:yes stop_codon:yes gene_type:complete